MIEVVFNQTSKGKSEDLAKLMLPVVPRVGEAVEIGVNIYEVDDIVYVISKDNMRVRVFLRDV